MAGGVDDGEPARGILVVGVPVIRDRVQAATVRADGQRSDVAHWQRGDGCRASDVDHRNHAAAAIVGGLVVGCVQVASVRTDYHIRSAAVPGRLRGVVAGIDDDDRPVVMDDGQLRAGDVRHEAFRGLSYRNPRYNAV